MECSKNNPQNLIKFNQIPGRIFPRSVCLALVLVDLLHLDENCFLFWSLLHLTWSRFRQTHVMRRPSWEIFLRHRFKPATIIFFNKTSNVIHALVDKRTRNKPVGNIFPKRPILTKYLKKKWQQLYLPPLRWIHRPHQKSWHTTLKSVLSSDWL